MKQETDDMNSNAKCDNNNTSSSIQYHDQHVQQRSSKMKYAVQLPPIHRTLQHLTLYESNERFYLIGSDRAKKRYKILKIDRTSPETLSVHEDPTEYTAAQMRQLLNMINYGCKGGLVKKTEAYGILGFIKFTRAYYMILVTQRRKVGLIGAHRIYEVKDILVVPLLKETQNLTSNLKNKINKDVETRYKDIFMSLDLSKDLYFSYTYDLSQTLQNNMLDATFGDSSKNHGHNEGNSISPTSCNNMFVWNSFLLDPIIPKIDDGRWLLPVICGYYGQQQVSIFGRMINIILIGRRSRFFAGTRYLKRGVTESGHVANHVESEQIVYDPATLVNHQSKGLFSSIVQVRGSIPLFWSQDMNQKIKPPIYVSKFDPIHDASLAHFKDLMQRYGSTVIILDLVKQHEKVPRESKLGQAFKESVECLSARLSPGESIQYIAWDFKGASKKQPEKVFNDLTAISERVLDTIGFFCSTDAFTGPKTHLGFRKQHGVLRTNCIDCLDRTNISQFFVGKCALAKQLYAIGILDHPNLVFYSNIVEGLMNLYQSMGDAIALQYGGSNMVSAGINHRGISWDMVTNIRRFYSNNFTDENKQDAINLLLGTYIPREGVSNLWELETDRYLHTVDSPRNLALQQSLQYMRDRYHKHGDSHQEDEFNEGSDDNNNNNSHTETSENLEFFEEFYEPNVLTSFSSMLNQTAPPVLLESDPSTMTPLQKEHLKSINGKMQKSRSIVESPHLTSLYETNSLLTDEIGTNPKDDFTFSRYVTQFKVDADDKRAVINPESFENVPFYSLHLNSFTFETFSNSKIRAKDNALYENYTTQFTTKANLPLRFDIDSPDDTSNGNRSDDQDGDDDKTVPTDYERYLNTCASLSKDSEQQHYIGETFQKLREKFFPHQDTATLLERIVKIRDMMRANPGGIKAEDRVRHTRPASRLFTKLGLSELMKGKLYSKCFVGSDAVDWVLQNCHLFMFDEPELITTREKATEFLQLLLDGKIFHHVLSGHPFIDGFFLYTFEGDQDIRVLNMAVEWTQPARKACRLASTLMSHVADLFQSHIVDSGSAKNGDFPALNLTGLIESEAYRNVMHTAAELQRVDLLSMTYLQKLCFFINTYNALFLHGILCIASIYGMSAIAPSQIETFCRTVSYQIGGFLFTLHEIKHGILRGNRRSYGAFFTPFDANTDPRARLSVSPVDVRVHFALSESFKKMPVLSVCNAMKINTALQTIAENFCANNVKLNLHSNEIILTTLFKRYPEDFGKTDEEIQHELIKYLPVVQRKRLSTFLEQSTSPVRIVFVDNIGTNPASSTLVASSITTATSTSTTPASVPTATTTAYPPSMGAYGHANVNLVANAAAK